MPSVGILGIIRVQVLVQVLPLSWRQAVVLDVVERRGGIAIIEPAEVKERHVPAAEEPPEEAVLRARTGHVEDMPGQRRELWIEDQRVGNEGAIVAQRRREWRYESLLVHGMAT